MVQEMRSALTQRTQVWHNRKPVLLVVEVEVVCRKVVSYVTSDWKDTTGRTPPQLPLNARLTSKDDDNVRCSRRWWWHSKHSADVAQTNGEEPHHTERQAQHREREV